MREAEVSGVAEERVSEDLGLLEPVSITIRRWESQRVH